MTIDRRLIDQAQDIFPGELVRIDRLGRMRRLIFALPSIDNGGYYAVQIKLIVPADYMPTLGIMIAGDGRSLQEPEHSLLYLHPEDDTAH